MLTLWMGTACAVAQDGSDGQSAMSPVETSRQGVSVRIDPRIELMAVIGLLADYPLTTGFESAYVVDVRAYFEAAKDHAAVKRFAAMAGQSFNFDAVPKAFASMSQPPGLELVERPDPDAVRRAGGLETLVEFTDLARGFARESRFAGFFDAHRGTYETIVERTFEHVLTAIGQLEDYAGIRLEQGRVVVSPLLHEGGFAMQGGQTGAQAFIGPAGFESDGIPRFGPADRLGSLVWHEFAHTFVNPLTEAHRDQVKALESKDSRFRQAMRRQAYPNWETIVSESVIRAIEVRLAHRVRGVEAGTAALERHLKRGFRHLPRLIALLEEFEETQRKEVSLRDFYPRLLQAFKDDD